MKQSLRADNSQSLPLMKRILKQPDSFNRYAIACRSSHCLERRKEFNIEIPTVVMEKESTDQTKHLKNISLEAEKVSKSLILEKTILRKPPNLLHHKKHLK